MDFIHWVKEVKSISRYLIQKVKIKQGRRVKNKSNHHVGAKPNRNVKHKPIQRVESKWAKTSVLLQNSDISKYVPETKKMSKDTLQSMLNSDKMVYIKPDKGSFGHGVMRVENLTTPEKPLYRYQQGNTPRTFPSFDQLYRSIENNRSKRSYLVQKGIHLLKYNNRRFDIRVMVQKSPEGSWESTGLIGRLSHPRKIVTNYHNGGTPLPVQTLLQPHLNKTELDRYSLKLKSLGVNVAKQLQRRYPGFKEIGIDVAIDDKMKPWILEVNTLPDPYIFNKLKDKRIFRRIYRYAKAYGRVG